jgi:hypothetical protein
MCEWGQVAVRIHFCCSIRKWLIRVISADVHYHVQCPQEVSPSCFAWLTSSICQATKNGKVVVALEGGYETGVIAHCFVQCCRALLGDEVPRPDVSFPSASGKRTGSHHRATPGVGE